MHSTNLTAPTTGLKLSYNPFKSDDFYYCGSGTKFYGCKEVKAFAAPKGQPMITIELP